MKFKKRSKVEVCSDEPGFLGAWFGGVLVSQDGFTCEVQYDRFVPDEEKPLVEKMDYSQIRPVPPNTNITKWVNGDAVEAYDNDCWCAGVVVKVLSENYFSVYFPSSCSEKAYHYSNLRSAQQWHNRKGSFALQARFQRTSEENPHVATSTRETSLVSSSEEKHTNAKYPNQCNIVERNVNSKLGLNFEGRIFLENSRNANGGVRKHKGRRSGTKPPLLVDRGSSKASNSKQALEDSGRCKLPNTLPLIHASEPLIHGSEPPYSDDKALKREHVCAHTIDGGFPCEEGCKDTKLRCSELPQTTDQKAVKISKNCTSVEVHTRSIPISLRGFGMDIDGAGCSVSTTESCTAYDLASHDERPNLEGKKGGIGHGAKSHCACVKNQVKSIIGRAEVHRLTTHKLELLAYRSVLQAFYAYGCLTWEREVLLTNLRLELHITCEEHSHELEQLSS